ncbi:hypothetical protein [Kocuria rosea]|uniref:hypothetical protein n=1 Tax=Kocuria rosea TaxID=1275 RepID=UPI00204084BC|nr:hypothetical protein [Kocuria rosea]MCM3686805.1 hypothetical protein [Kocuria rosea]HST71829.1 hypothetical protein [Kocuria rosea]
MSDPLEARRARRRRTGGWMLGAGIVALFVSTFAVPEAIIHLAHASGPDGAGLSARGVVLVVVGAATLLGGGALAVVGFNRRRSAGEALHPEDLLDDEEFGDGPLRPFDPERFRRRPGRADDQD